MRIFSRARAAVAMSAVGAVLVSGCGSIYDVPLPGGADVGKDPITVHAEFRDVLDLVPQSTVKIDDVTVGKVSAIDLKDYTADVTLNLPRDVDLPDNAQATIRQTSLLGEKFVSLSPPKVAPSSGRLGTGDVIPLSRTGRNPEVEEVLGALSLVLNGGGVGQLKSIAAELNNALGGREADVRSVLHQLDEFVGQLDQNKAAIVRAIDSLNRLATQLKKQDGTIKLALDDLPAAIKSINGQRADLVKTLKALQNLSGVGVRVISQSKAATIASLKDLSPVLDKIAAAGANFPKSIQVALTYPFIDEAVGRNPLVARNVHMGDYVNLDARLNLDLASLPALPSIGLPSPVCQVTTELKKQFVKQANQAVAALPNIFPIKGLKDDILTRVIRAVNALQCNDVLNQQAFATILSDTIANLIKKYTPAQVRQIVNSLIDVVNKGLGSTIKLPSLGGSGSGGSGGSGGGSGGGGLGGILSGGNGGGILGLGRTGTAYVPGKKDDVLNGPAGDVDKLGYNSTLGSLLLQGVVK